MSQLNGTEELDAYILRNTRTKANVSRNKPSLSSRPLYVNLMRSPKFPVAKATTNNLKSSGKKTVCLNFATQPNIFEVIRPHRVSRSLAGAAA